MISVTIQYDHGVKFYTVATFDHVQAILTAAHRFKEDTYDVNITSVHTDICETGLMPMYTTNVPTLGYVK